MIEGCNSTFDDEMKELNHEKESEPRISKTFKNSGGNI